MLVIGALGELQRTPRALECDVAGDAAGNHECHGHDLAFQMAQIAQQLPIYCPYHRRLRTEALLRFRSSWAMRPSPMVITRSPIAAIGALWVITTVVVPSS